MKKKVKKNKKYIIIALVISVIIFLALMTCIINTEVGDKIAVIPVKGMITLNGGNSLLQTTTSGNEISEKIKEANEDPQIKAIVLEINSPGGTVQGSKVVADTLKQVEKPVVSVITESGTSGAYWIASQTDLIVADELSYVGSISVLGSYLEFSGLMDDFNVTYRRLITGEYKDLGTPLKEMTPEEEALIMERLNTVHEYFVNEVAQGRGMTNEEVSELANGLFYFGMQAKTLGLIDELGTKEDAINFAKQLAEIEDGTIKEYEEKESFFDAISKYTTYSSFYIGQGIGSVLVSQDSSDMEINV
ncbi:MAG: signal peptide peptidase SppA [archaeon]